MTNYYKFKDIFGHGEKARENRQMLSDNGSGDSYYERDGWQ